MLDPEDFRKLPEFPEYMINFQGEIRRIDSGMIMETTHDGSDSASLTKDGKKYHRGIRGLIKSAFHAN